MKNQFLFKLKIACIFRSAFENERFELYVGIVK